MADTDSDAICVAGLAAGHRGLGGQGVDGDGQVAQGGGGVAEGGLALP